jgi:glycosyltransferase involved in cell wall biosynthesis
MNNKLDLALLIPCHNEEMTIEKVVSDFKVTLPNLMIYVYDNASTDETIKAAKLAGALVFKEPNKGKGNVIRRMFADIEADIFIMVDGDATYDASIVSSMIDELVNNNLDIVIATRKASDSNAYRSGHVLGNKAITRAVSFIFNGGFTDMLSGYRVMSRRFVKSFPIVSSGFEIETEMAIHILQLGIPYKEIETKYDARPVGSESKLNTWADGMKILKMIILLFKEQKPFQLFGIFFLLLLLLSFVLSIPLMLTFIDTGLVPRLPTAILIIGITILAFVSLSAGIILDSVSRAKLENKRLHYINLQSIHNKLGK